MKKKISLMLCLVIMVLVMAACGEDPKSVTYFGIGYSDFQKSMEQLISQTLLPLNAEGMAYFQNSGDETAAKLVTTWSEAVADLGTYQKLGDFSVTQAQDTVTLEQRVVYEKRQVVVTCVYTYNYEIRQLELTDANADLVYTLGEKMSKAALNTLMGMGTVFVVLILISLIIYGFKVIPYIQGRFSKKEAENTKPAESTVVEQIGQREERQLTDDLELVAVITAAIAAGTGASADSFVVRSIRRKV